MKNEEQLFNSLKLIRARYDHIIYNSENEFNLFSILHNESDEVNLHSKFIYELLNPKSKHYKNKLFITLFLEQLGISISRDDYIEVKREYKNIDILITQNKIAIIIENKIWSGDQAQQIERYYNIIKNEGFTSIFIIYLTPFGNKASKQSIGSVPEELIKYISYQDDINAWLIKCIKEVSLEPTLRENISQYKKLINKITGSSLSRKLIMEMKNMILRDNNIEIAHNIMESFIEAKIEIQCNFWKSLNKSLEQKKYVVNYNEVELKKNINKFYKQKKNNKYYGISFDIKEIDNETKIVYRIEIDYNIYHGFRIESKEKGIISKDKKYDCIVKIIQEISNDFSRSEWWLGWKYTKKIFNFRAFNNKTVFNLSSKEVCSEETKK